MRLLAPDGAAVQTTVHGRTYTATGGGVYTVPDSAVRDLRKVGFTLAGGPPPKTAGFPCGSCGFASLFRRCSRCGATHTPLTAPRTSET